METLSTSLLCLLPLVSFCQAGELRMMSLVGNERYMQANDQTSVDESTCRGIEFHDDEEYADYCDPNYEEDCEDDPVCHFSKLNDTLVNEGHFPGVENCCPFHGFMESAVCDGTDDTGDPITYKELAVCVHHSGDQTLKYRPTKQCNSSCHLVNGFLNEQDVNIAGTILNIKGKEYSDFCLSLRCDNAGERFGHWFEACGDCKNTTVINQEIREKWAKLQPTDRINARTSVDSSGAFEDIENQVSANDIPFCCGPDGVLNKQTGKCDAGERDSTVNQSLSSCTLTNKKSIEVTTNLTNNVLCVNRLNSNEEGGLSCRHHCQGENRCVQACMEKGDTFDFQTKLLGFHNKEFDIATALGLSPGGVAYSEPHACSMTTNKTILYPEWQCDLVDILPNGSLVRKKEPSDVLDYGEFCIEPLGDEHLVRGSYRIKTCRDKPEKERNEKNFVYYTVVLCISIICLIVTIGVYVRFRDALLRTEYNKFMLNFTSMLLLAFLTLIVQQNLGKEAMTPFTCSVVTLINQFAIIAAFTLMTLMSYSICRQIHGMKVMDPKTRFMRRLIIAYSVPAIITILTMIVELAAPHCAAAKPSFGVKSCHFYGGVGKFVWLYLPILMLLIVNTAMFVFIAVNIFKNHSSSKAGGSRSEKMDTMCIYLRLFLGMGIIWYFEILAFALTSYNLNPNIFILTDTLNMCQGLWCFIIFVCKRNVMKVVRGKSKRLYSIARQVSRAMSTGGKLGRGTLTPQSTEDKTEDVSMSATYNEPNADTQL